MSRMTAALATAALIIGVAAPAWAEVARAKAQKAHGKEACSLLYKPDLMWNPVRYACVLEQLRRQFKKFKKYYPVKNKR